MKTSDQNNSDWNLADNYSKEERTLQPIRKIVIKGSVDVVFRRGGKPILIVAGETENAIASVKTNFNDGKLVIEREGMSINFSGNSVSFYSSVRSFIMGSITNGKPIGEGIIQGKVIVCLALPEAPAVKIRGSGDVTMLDLKQDMLELEIEGSGDIVAYGEVAHLNVKIAGSGDVDASELVADQANLSIAGSGDIEAFVRTNVRARVAGSGNIIVCGNPLKRDHSIAGSGRIKFR